MIDFPASPTIGQVFTSGAQSWTWDGTKWVASGTYVGPPQYPAENRIINGDFRIDQRNAGALIIPATGTYFVDRWAYNGSTASKFSSQRVPTGAAYIGGSGFGYYLNLTSQSAYTPPATEQYLIFQSIEADFFTDFMFGSATAQPATLSFWAGSSLAGTFSGALSNYPGPATRSYPFTFSLPGASTWMKIVVTIPGDIAGTWAQNGNAGAAMLRFDLGSGANFRGPAGAWASANYVGVIGAVSVVGTAAATFGVTGVKLEIGSVATPFNHPTMAKALADCQRYYQQVGYTGIGGGANYTAGASLFGTFPLPVAMRAAPTLGPFNPPPIYTNCSGLAAISLGLPQVTFQATATAAGVSTYVSFGYTLSAEL
jgi:hypothetical protein